MADDIKSEALRLADAIDPLTRRNLDNLTCAAAAAELRRLAAVEAQRDALKQTLHDELAGNLRLRDLGGARPDEPMLTFLERIIAERDALLAALHIAEAALSDIGDADREPGDDVAWCEARAAEAIPKARAAIKAVEGETE